VYIEPTTKTGQSLPHSHLEKVTSIVV